jgi:hypothetical protein
LLSCAAASQSAVTYEYEGYINLGPHPTAVRFATGVADENGGLFFGDNGTDFIYYAPDMLGTMGVDTDDANVMTVSDQFSFASGSSWQNTSYVNGNYFISGRSNTAPPFTQTARATIISGGPPTGPADWNVETFFPEGEFGGIAAINEDLIVMADFVTGALSFFDLSSGSAVKVGSTISGSGFYTPSLDYDPVAGKIYAYMVANLEIGGVAVFNSNGTAAGTTYLGTNPIIPTKPTSWTIAPGPPPVFTFSSYYSQLAVNPAQNRLILGFSQGTAPELPGAGAQFQVFDMAGATPELLWETDGSDVITVDGNESLIEGRFGPTRHSMTSTFFSNNSENYVAIAPNNGRLYIYREVDSDLEVVVPTITLLNANPNALTAVSFGVDFSKSVPAFDETNVALTGTLTGDIFVGGTDPNYIVLVDTGNDAANGTLGIELLANFSDGNGVPYDGNNGASALYTINAGGGGGEFDGDYNNDGEVNVADISAFAQDVVDGVFDVE